MLANISLIFSSLCSTPFLWGPAAKVLKVCDNVLSKARQKEELEITELSVVQQDLEASTIPRSAAICSVPSAQPSSEAGHSLLPSKARPAAATLAALHRKAVLGNIMLSWKFLLFLWHIISFTSFFFFLLYCPKFDIVNHFSTWSTPPSLQHSLLTSLAIWKLDWPKKYLISDGFGSFFSWGCTQIWKGIVGRRRSRQVFMH